MLYRNRRGARGTDAGPVCDGYRSHHSGLFLPGRLRGQMAILRSITALVIHSGPMVGTALLGLQLGAVGTNPGVAAAMAMSISVPMSLLLAGRTRAPAEAPSGVASPS